MSKLKIIASHQNAVKYNVAIITQKCSTEGNRSVLRVRGNGPTTIKITFLQPATVT